MQKHTTASPDSIARSKVGPATHFQTCSLGSGVTHRNAKAAFRSSSSTSFLRQPSKNAVAPIRATVQDLRRCADLGFLEFLWDLAFGFWSFTLASLRLTALFSSIFIYFHLLSRFFTT
jgi:hypothetical protein